MSQGLLEFMEFEMSLDTGLHLFQLERLGYVIRPASLKRFDLVFLSDERAEKDNGSFRKRRGGFQPLAHLVTIHFRHVDIQQKQIWRILGCRRQCQPAPGKRSYLVPV